MAKVTEASSMQEDLANLTTKVAETEVSHKEDSNLAEKQEESKSELSHKADKQSLEEQEEIKTDSKESNSNIANNIEGGSEDKEAEQN